MVSRRPRWWCLTALLILPFTAGGARAQRAGSPTLSPAARVAVDSGGVRVPWYAPVASLAVPGLGQATLHQNRALAYIAVELYALLGYRSQLTEADRARGRYLSLARDVARAIVPGDRPNGPWSYYESMEKYVESGVFDRIPGGDVDPEIDETTYNGSIWRLARNTYWPDPDVPPPADSPAYTQAVSLYLQRAVQPAYQWSWRNAALEHDLYNRNIARANDSSRRARQQLGILLANHLLSMADAFATVRVRYPGAASVTGTSISVTVPWPRPR